MPAALIVATLFCVRWAVQGAALPAPWFEGVANGSTYRGSVRLRIDSPILPRSRESRGCFEPLLPRSPASTVAADLQSPGRRQPDDIDIRVVATHDGVLLPLQTMVEVASIGMHEVVVVTLRAAADGGQPSTRRDVLNFVVLDEARGVSEWALPRWTPPAHTASLPPDQPVRGPQLPDLKLWLPRQWVLAEVSSNLTALTAGYDDDHRRGARKVPQVRSHDRRHRTSAPAQPDQSVPLSFPLPIAMAAGARHLDFRRRQVSSVRAARRNDLVQMRVSSAGKDNEVDFVLGHTILKRGFGTGLLNPPPALLSRSRYVVLKPFIASRPSSKVGHNVHRAGAGVTFHPYGSLPWVEIPSEIGPNVTFPPDTNSSGASFRWLRVSNRDGRVRVFGGGQLTLAAGTVVLLAEGAGFVVQAGGRIVAEGHEEAPVVFSLLPRPFSAPPAFHHATNDGNHSQRRGSPIKRMGREADARRMARPCPSWAGLIVSPGARLSLSNTIMVGGGGSGVGSSAAPAAFARVFHRAARHGARNRAHEASNTWHQGSLHPSGDALITLLGTRAVARLRRVALMRGGGLALDARAGSRLVMRGCWVQGFAAGLRLNNSEADIGGSFFSDFPHDLSAPLTDDRLAGVFSLGRDMQHAFKAKKQARVVRELALATRTRLQGGTLDAAGTLTTSHGWGARAAHTRRNAHSLHALAARVGMVGPAPVDSSRRFAFADADNDGIYAVGGVLRMSDSIILDAKDDGVDSGTGAGGRVFIGGSWVENCFHECVALSNNGKSSKEIVVAHTALASCQQGLELGFSTRHLLVRLRHLLLLNNGIGLRVGDNYGWATDGIVWASKAMFVRQLWADLLNLHRLTFASLPSRLFLDGSALQHRSGPSLQRRPGVAYDRTGASEFFALQAACVLPCTSLEGRQRSLRSNLREVATVDTDADRLRCSHTPTAGTSTQWQWGALRHVQGHVLGSQIVEAGIGNSLFQQSEMTVDALLDTEWRLHGLRRLLPAIGIAPNRETSNHALGGFVAGLGPRDAEGASWWRLDGLLPSPPTDQEAQVPISHRYFQSLAKDTDTNHAEPAVKSLRVALSPALERRAVAAHNASGTVLYLGGVQPWVWSVHRLCAGSQRINRANIRRCNAQQLASLLAATANALVESNGWHHRPASQLLADMHGTVRVYHHRQQLGSTRPLYSAPKYPLQSYLLSCVDLQSQYHVDHCTIAIADSPALPRTTVAMGTAAASELHSLVLWSAIGAEDCAAYMAYLDARHDISVTRVMRVELPLRSTSDAQGTLDEEFFQHFYGDSYYYVFLPSGDKVGMSQHKGVNGFTIITIEDPWPCYAHRDGKGLVNVNMYDLKILLRTVGWAPGAYQIHASQTRREAAHDFTLFFGAPMPPLPPIAALALLSMRDQNMCDSLVSESLLGACDKPHNRHPHTLRETEAAQIQVEHAMLVSELGGGRQSAMAAPHPLAASFVRIGTRVHTDDVITAILRSEFYKYKLDVASLQRELRASLLAPASLGGLGRRKASGMRSMQRTALLASTRLALLLHLPSTMQWFSISRFPVSAFGNFRVLSERRWEAEIPRCSTVQAAWSSMSAAVARMIDGRKSNCANLVHVVDERIVGAGPETEARELPSSWHTRKIADLVNALERHAQSQAQRPMNGKGSKSPLAIDRTIVAIAASADGTRTLWDGNHRAIALYGFLSRRLAGEQNACPHFQTARGSGCARSAPSSIPSADLLLGVDPGLLQPHKGSFFCHD